MRVPAPLTRAAGVLSGSATTAGYLAAWRLVRLAPERQARAAFDLIADRIHAGDGRSVQRLRANLARIVEPGLLEDTVHDGVRRYLRYWCEAFRLPSWPTEDLVRRTRVTGEEHLVAALAPGRGVVAALPHMGNWDWAGAWVTATHTPLMTVAERLRPERLFDEFVRYREEGIGMRVVPLTGGGTPMAPLTSWVQDGGLVCLLSDRDLSRTGTPVTLFGETARFPAGPAVLAARTGAVLLPVTLGHEGDDLDLRIHPPVAVDDPAAAMQRVADVFGAEIAHRPADWHMMQRVFEADL